MTPRSFARYSRRGVQPVPLALFVVIAATSLYWRARFPTSSYGQYGLWIAMATWLPFGIYNRVQERRLRWAVTAARGRLCTHCDYDLTCSDPQGRCPECGRDYAHAECVRQWRRCFPAALKAEDDFNNAPSRVPER